MAKNDFHANWHAFMELCQKISSRNNLEELFDLFFTRAEQEDLAARYAILHELLLSDLTQREIALKLGISIAKITRGSNALKTLDPNLIKQISKEMQK